MKCEFNRWPGVLAVLGLLTAAPTGALPPNFPRDLQLPAQARGEDALKALGQRLPEVAAFYRKSPGELRELLRTDLSIWADRNGRLFHVCDWQPAPEESVTGNSIGPTDPSPFSSEQTFRLHSRPGAGKVIYLDFDGHDASATSWGADAVGRPFDTDGSPYTFSTTERDRIVYVWQRVAEDFAMYDLDVTTEEPPAGGLINSGSGETNFGIRVVIAGSSSDWYGSAGGVAYIGSFDDGNDLPCWVFPKSLGPDNEKYIAEAVSHEVGHTLGLSHDGTTSGTTYYTGQGNWAPIMGVGYYEPIAQWSKGEYANANQTQDDLAIMLNYGAVYRTDDHGNTPANATPLNGVAFTTNGVITTRTDLDFFTFTTGTGRVTINVNRPPRDSNLRIEVKLYDSLGTLLQTTNVADTTSGTQPVTLTAVLAAGTYAFSVDGIGADNPLSTGYTDYASLGQYTVTGTLPYDSAWLPTAGGAGYARSDAINWASNTAPSGAGAIVRINNNILGDQTINFAGPLTLGRLLLGDADASHTFTLQDNGGSLTFAALTNAATLSKTTGADDVITLPIALNSNLLLTNSTAQTLTLSGHLTGPGSLTKAGAGQLIVEGAATHSGGTIIAAGSLALGLSATLTGDIEVQSSGTLDAAALAGGLTLNSNQTLRGEGVVTGDATARAGATLQAGAIGKAGVLTLDQSLSLEDGARLSFDLAGTDVPAGGINDLLFIGGNLTLAGTVTVDFNFLTNTLASPGTYTLIYYAGALTGGAANLVTTGTTDGYAYAFDDSVAGEIRVHVTGGPDTLVWTGATTNQWAASTFTNWLAGGEPAQFRQFDAAIFDEGGAQAPLVSLVDTVRPIDVTANNLTAYTFAGSGKISGAAGITKSGAGNLTLATSNDFTGPVSINEGTLQLNHPAALGSPINGTTITNGATLDLNAMALGAEPVKINGAGTIISSAAAAQINALRFLTLNGAATLGGVGRWDIRAQPTASLIGNNFSLTKTGPNEIRLADLGNTGLGEIHVTQGTLGIQDSTTLGNASSNLIVELAGTLALWNTDVNALSKKLALNGGAIRNEAGNNLFTGTVGLNSNASVFVNAGLEFQGIISGPGGLTKTGPGTLSLKAANTFTGAVTVSTGTLRAGNAAAFGCTNNGVVIASDARLDLAGFNLGAEPVTVTGDGLGNAGAIVNYGSSQQNALRFVTFSGNTTFGGISRWDIRANPTGSLTGNNRTLTKRGPNEIWLIDLGNTGLGPITIAEGTLGIQGTTALGSTFSNLTVGSGCTLAISNTGPNVLSKALTLNGGKIYNIGGTNFFAGNAGLSGSNNVDTATATQLEFSGTLSGTGSIFKTGPGALILSGNNIRSGFTVISAGTLQLGNGGGSGSPGTGAITNYGTLIYNRTNDQTFANVIAGSGSLTKLGRGVLTLNAANTFTGAVTVNSLNAGTLRLRHNTAAGTGVKIMNLKSGGSPNSAGTFGVEVENNITLGTNLLWNISNDGLANAPFIPALRSRSGNNTIAGRILIQSGGGGARFVSDAGSTLNLAGPITTDVAAGRDLFLDGAGSGTVSSDITNASAGSHFLTLHKEGAGSWTLAGLNNYGGPTLVKAGELQVLGALGTNLVAVSNGAALRGAGILHGATVVEGTLAPGTAVARGTLGISNALTLSGTAQFRLAKSPAPDQDQIVGVTTLTYGGTLNVTHSGEALAAGDTFQLFSAANYTGSFNSISLPPTPSGLIWSNRLTLDGSLLVVPVATPTITAITFDGTNLNLQFPTEPGVNYVLQQATNLEPPVLWLPVSTNLGDGNVMTLSPAMNPDQWQQFFQLFAF